MSTNDSDVLISWVGSLELGYESGSTNNVEGGDAEEALGVVDALALEDFGDDRDRRVDLATYVNLCQVFDSGILIQGWR